MKMKENGILWWILAIAGCGMIFYATSSPGFTGSSTSSLLQSILAVFGTNDIVLVIADLLNFILRKLGHIVAFGVLAVLFCLALNKSKRPFLYAWIITTLYAFFDEFHQSLVPNRTSSIMDVGLDSLGAVIALVLLRKYKK
ncbi:VanZ family protein [Litchfieldia alkalitelluris]|uniref:VanZ family protein n=1 Tax=Litchfieldia alkalitelluris TaxID=304268 RepID=UPI000997FBD3|nr:VanZ family protein [Litchfieldia alkalitelluris]